MLAKLAILLSVVPAMLCAETIVSAEDLLEDFRIFRAAYEQLHPGLYRYNTRAQMDGHFETLKRELSKAQPRRTAFLAFARFTSKVKCGHSYPNFYNQTEAVVQEVFGGQTRVPFEFEWIGRQMVVTRNLSGVAGLKPGSVITRINGLGTGKVLDALLPYTRADGTNIGKRLVDLSVESYSRFPAFDVYYPLLFPLRGPEYQLQVRDPIHGKTESIVVPAWTLEQRTAALKGASVPRGDEQVWFPRMLDANTAYLRMETWAMYNSKWKWDEFLHTYFDQLIEQGTSKLIIDLRGNEGGLDCGNVILSRLIDRDLPTNAYKRKTRYRKTPVALDPYLDTWDKSFRDWGGAATELGDGFFQLAETDAEGSPDIVKPQGKRYTGKVVVIMDSSNSSATFQFEETLKRHKLATLVGQPGGGNLRGINGGGFFFLRLPKSGLEVDVPLIGRFPDAAEPDATLAPDILVPRTARDLANGVDAELAAALRAR